ncbi:exodeoxyribonuclease 7 large subunit [mine drainage metagenome]|uniref:Exodeoxyribonuclease 7 large subunit n=1 Tax=mine drainage metagenome TaxID=410659 RepID=A0A1J5QTZ8_9ZZZZ
MADLHNPSILSVGDLNRMARNVLERSFPLLWVAGEISNLTRAASGHWYFSLKDERAQVRCVMFRNRNAYLDWAPREGDHVEARVQVTLFEPRGDFQLTVEGLRKAGLGALFEAFERLRVRLEQEGLFSQARKRPLPTLPQQIGIVTSPDAAALRDVLATLRRRMPSIKVVIYPTPVQGRGAAERIAAALRTASARAECDVLILCRGGGSMEDLWQFNEEVVARAISASTIPVVCGVGHETDFTIADFVADLRAPTPTAAAEMVSPEGAALLLRLAQLQQRMQRQTRNLLAQRVQQLDYLSRRLLSPLQQIAHRKSHLDQLALRLKNGMARQLATRSQQLMRLSQNLAHLNPHAVLGRGYALVQTADGSVVQDSASLHVDQALKISFAEGGIDASVTRIRS